MAREEMISPEIQRAAITDWARRTNRRIIDWITDLDQTGRNFRRKVMGAIECIEKGDAIEIGVYRYDRWGRNAVESLANCRRVELVGGQVQSATEPLDPETAIGKYSRTNAFAIAEMQSDQISENWKAAQANRIERGLTTSGSPRWGYVRLGRMRNPADPSRYMRDQSDPNGERYEPDYAAGTADIHVEMYNDYIRGMSFSGIAHLLNIRDIRNVRGGPWSDVTVKNVLDSGFAAGYLQVHNQECRCGKPSKCKRRVYIKGAHDSIFDEETWQTYLKTRQKRSRQSPKSRYPKYPLTGLFLCGHCCNSMKIQSGGQPSQAGYGYRCSRWHHYRDCDGPFPRRALVEAEVLKEVRTWAADIDEGRAIATARKSRRVAAEVDAERLTRACLENDAALKRLAKQKVLDGDRMPPGLYEELRDELLQTREDIEHQLEQLQDVAEVNREELLPIAAGLVDKWEILPAGTRREMLSKMIRHVKAYRTKEGPVRIEVTPVWVDCSCRACQHKPLKKQGCA